MTNERKLSRKLGVGFGIAIAAGITLLSAQQAWAEDDRDPIVGSWNCQVPPAGGAPAFTIVKTMHAGGTLSEIDTAAPPSQESPTTGVWHRTGSRTYGQEAFQYVWDVSGNLIGIFHYTGPSNAITLSLSGNEINILGTATLYDPNGVVLQSFPFTVHCARF
jgi:YD repeat-containing protein